MAKKVYGVKGVIEWHALIPCGKSTMSVKFTGGTLTGYGISPARFATNDRMVQDIIERSEYFKCGKIILMNVYGEVNDNASDKSSKANSQAQSKDDDGSDKEVIAVSSIEDAREVLKERGISWTKLKTESAVLAIAASLNIEFIFK